MAEGKPSPPSLNELGRRLSEAQARARPREEPVRDRGRTARGIGFGMRVATELVAGLVIGVGIGLLLDRWLGTTPWLLVVFFLLGAAAGLLNVYRAMAAQMRPSDQSKGSGAAVGDGRNRDG
jgi:ATP synthase protein I